MPVALTMPLPYSILRIRSLWLTCSLPGNPHTTHHQLLPVLPMHALCFWPVCGSSISLLSSQNYLSSKRSASFSCQQNRKSKSYDCDWRQRWGSKHCPHPPYHQPSLANLLRALQLRAPNRILPLFPQPERHFCISVPTVTWDLPILFRDCLLFDAFYTKPLWVSGFLLKYLTPLSVVMLNICLYSTRRQPNERQAYGNDEGCVWGVGREPQLN